MVPRSALLREAGCVYYMGENMEIKKLIEDVKIGQEITIKG
jgi:hypothetical protein